MYKLQVSRDEDPNFSLFAFKLNMPHGKTWWSLRKACPALQ